jgi:hypothetical protein
MPELAEYFNDPFEPQRSLQLNSRYWKGERFQHLDAMREAESDIRDRRYYALRRSLKPVIALLPPEVRRPFLSRLVYSISYTTTFEPIRFSLKLSDRFLEANAIDRDAREVERPVNCRNELQSIVDWIHSIYREHYGFDALTSSFALRYAKANDETIGRMTAQGQLSDFHFDEGKDFTCIIYLSPAAQENGCFTYIRGSNNAPKSHILRALHQVVDHDLRLSTPQERIGLPLELRGSLRVGDYLDDEKRDRVWEAATEVTGGPGEGIIFNGFDTIHRGGQPLAGDRAAVFISTRGRFSIPLKKIVYDRLGCLWL